MYCSPETGICQPICTPERIGVCAPPQKKILTNDIRFGMINRLWKTRWCGSKVEQRTCNAQVEGSIPPTSSTFTIEYGGVPEWPKGTDCKSAGYAFGGSNPPSSTKREYPPKKVTGVLLFRNFSGQFWGESLSRNGAGLAPSLPCLTLVLTGNDVK